MAIYGCGGHGFVVADAAYLCNWGKLYYYDDDLKKKQIPLSKNYCFKGNMTGFVNDAHNLDGFVVAIGNNIKRRHKTEEIIDVGVENVSIIHPRAIVSCKSTISNGTVIFASAVINPNVAVGIGCIINTAATVDHDSVIEDYVHISPGAHLGGSVYVGSGSWIGMGAIIKEGIQIGNNAIVGAGAVVVRDVRPNSTVLGIPAKEVSRKE